MDASSGPSSVLTLGQIFSFALKTLVITLCAPPGTGKTTVLRALHGKIRANFPNIRVGFVEWDLYNNDRKLFIEHCKLFEGGVLLVGNTNSKGDFATGMLANQLFDPVFVDLSLIPSDIETIEAETTNKKGKTVVTRELNPAGQAFLTTIIDRVSRRTEGNSNDSSLFPQAGVDLAEICKKKLMECLNTTAKKEIPRLPVGISMVKDTVDWVYDMAHVRLLALSEAQNVIPKEMLPLPKPPVYGGLFLDECLTPQKLGLTEILADGGTQIGEHVTLVYANLFTPEGVPVWGWIAEHLGKAIEVVITGFKTRTDIETGTIDLVTALVELPAGTPILTKSAAHITVFCGPGRQPVESNDLINNADVQVVRLPEPITVQTTVQYR